MSADLRQQQLALHHRPHAQRLHCLQGPAGWRQGVSASSFDAGGFAFKQATTNPDVSRYFPELLGGSNIAFGAEARQERYRITAGEPGSLH